MQALSAVILVAFFATGIELRATTRERLLGRQACSAAETRARIAAEMEASEDAKWASAWKEVRWPRKV